MQGSGVATAAGLAVSCEATGSNSFGQHLPAMNTLCYVCSADSGLIYEGLAWLNVHGMHVRSWQ